MSDRTQSRRSFLAGAGLAAGAMLAGIGPVGAAEETARHGGLHLASNQYPWLVFYRRENRNFGELPDMGIEAVAAGDIDGFEPIITEPQQIDQFAPLLKKHGLEMRSLYVNSLLHEPDEAAKSIDQVLAIAEKAKTIGTRIIVTNPSPIRWGGPENKNDAQLRVQARAINKLGAGLKSLGLTLSYHNHDIELRNAAREFHHMMVGTDPSLVTLCLDAHWIYRGAGNSSVALFDVLRLYGPRVTELHLRQSIDGIWTETLCDGDIDYRAIAKHLLAIGLKPHLVLEQAVETGTPKKLDAVEAHRQSCRYAADVFAGMAG